MSRQPTPPNQSESKKVSPHSFKNRLMRVLWILTQSTLFRYSPRPCHRWRNLLLRIFGADLHPTARVYRKATIWAPWNLIMGERATIADDVDCYCVKPITLQSRVVISQYSYLCGATHDFELSSRPLVPMPITIGEGTWIAADVFVAPGVTIGKESVVGARSSVFTDLPDWKVCIGSPAKPIRDRIMKDEPNQ
ncbi:MAG: putative colanic acid biosynthesis acetyltransferase [Phycisphaerales bacterium]